MDAVAVLGAIASLVAVLVSGTVALVTLRSSQREAAATRSQEFLMALLPRRVEAFEEVWRALYLAEGGSPLSEQQRDRVVERSLWLPEKAGKQVLSLLAQEGLPDSDDTRRVRDALKESSGSTALESIQSMITVDGFRVKG